jgi:hypothetical protein
MPKLSKKHIQIDKANQKVLIVTGVAAFVVVFSLVASQALFSQLMYQNKIISAKKQALSQLKDNRKAVGTLTDSYGTFVQSSPNIIGGSAFGVGPKDGDNAKLILDALPSKYDFPALATSIEKILVGQNAGIVNITGTDDEVAQGAAQSSDVPKPVAVPFEVATKGNYQTIQNVTKAFESSIRPIQLQKISLTGNNADLTLNATAQTFFQPEKTFSVKKESIK